MLNICTHRIVFELCLMEKEEEEEKMNKIEIFMFGFLDFAKGEQSF